MEKNQNNPLNPCEEVLAHHGILGMKWGIRRYQPYPSDYTGDGKFVGKLAARKAAKIEKRQARHQAKTNTRIKNAVDTGDKKKLKKYQDEMTPEEYEKKYAETVKNGIDNAVKDRDKSALKKYKEDLNKRDYKHQQDRIDFKEAVDNDKNKKVDRLLSKVDPEDVTEATNLIKSRVALQDQKLSKIRQDSELMAKMDKLNSGVSKISKFATNVSSITTSFLDVNKKVTEFASAAKDAADKEEKRKLNNVIKSGDVVKIEQYKDKMDYNQLKEAYGKAYVMNSREIDKAIADGNLDEIYKRMPWMNAEDMSKIITKIKNLESRGAAFSDDISYEDVLAHHGILGMKWGIRRYQNKDGSLTKEGREKLKIDKYDRRNQDFIIPKGTKANRWVSTSRIQDYKVLKGSQGVNEYLKRIEDDEKRLETKYVSIDDIKRDGKPSGYDYYMSWFTNEFYEPESAYVNEYIVKKDVKVAAASKVIDALIEDVGEVKMKDLLENNRSINDLTMKYTQNRELRDRVNEKFKNMGYDAVEDINDNETNMPVIFLNSTKQLGAPINKTSGEKAIEDYYKKFK